MATTPRRVHLWLKQSFTFNEEASFKESDLEAALCRNIDEALLAFRIDDEHCLPPATNVAEQEEEHDWILDGTEEDEYHARRSLELMEMLKAPDIEDIVGVGAAGQCQDFKFAEFASENGSGDSEYDDNDDDDDDVFGAFQEASAEKQSANGQNESGTAESNGGKAVPVERMSIIETLVEEKKDSEQILPHEEEEEETDSSDGEFSDVPDEVRADNRVRASSSIVSDIFSESVFDEEELEEEWSCIDLTTPEGRFVQRRRAKSSSLPISIPQHFYQEEDESSSEVLRSFPWDRVPMCQETWRGVTDEDNHAMMQVEEHLMNQLMELDAWLASVTNQTLQQITSRKSSLDIANHHLRELNHSLTICDIYTKKSKTSLKEARGNADEFTGLASGTYLLESWDQRDVYRDLQSLLNNCTNLLEQEKRLKEQIADFGQNTSRFQDIINSAKEFSASAHKDDQLSRVKALDELRDRADHILDSFATKIESVLVNHVTMSCASWKEFSSAEYGNLLQAMLCVRNQGDNKGFADFWTKCIQDAFLFEVEKCLSRALLDPTNVSDSNYDKELLDFSYALKQDHGDFSKLKTISHNLVTIRFDFEADETYLPMVYHRLCLLLTDVLYCHNLLVNWQDETHNDQDKNVVKQIRHLLVKFKSKLWKRCEKLLATCLEEYINFCTKKKLFPNKTDETTWVNDLEAMHDILQLTQQFSKIGQEFLGRRVSLLDESSSLRGKLCNVFRKHLRAVHVESMNSMGFMLSKESWQLVPLHHVKDGLGGYVSTETELKAYLVKFVNDTVQRTLPTNRLWHNRMRDCHAIFAEYPSHGNPFGDLSADSNTTGSDDLIVRKDLKWTSSDCINGLEIKETGEINVYGLLAMMMEHELTFDSRIAIDSCFKGFSKSMARLILIIKRLPFIVTDVTKVLQNVSDLFLATVFRLCAGSAMNERLILGLERPIPYQMSFANRKNATPMIGFGRRSAQSPRPEQPITARLEAEICSPLSCDRYDALATFIQRAQSSLEGIVKLDLIQKWIDDPVAIMPEESQEEYLCKVSTALEKRQAACWSCLFVAAMLDLVRSFVVSTTKDTLTSLLGESDAENDVSLSGVTLLSDYVNSVFQVTPKLIVVVTRMACMRGIGGRRIVQEIGRVDWSMNHLSESANNYVELVCGRFVFLWRFLSTSAKLPVSVRAHTWENLVGVGYLTFLEGFARVPDCSTEGRSLMSMDLGAFASGISPSIVGVQGFPAPPSTATLPRGRAYVDTYIKVSYFPQKDILEWIAENHASYQLNHCLALTTAEFMLKVKEMYMSNGGEEVTLES